MIIEVCIGSSCHIKGSHEIVEMMQNALNEHKLMNDVTLAGCFCTGKCNRIGVTVKIDDVAYTGITTTNFSEFFTQHVLNPLKK